MQCYFTEDQRTRVEWLAAVGDDLRRGRLCTVALGVGTGSGSTAPLPRTTVNKARGGRARALTPRLEGDGLSLL